MTGTNVGCNKTIKWIEIISKLTAASTFAGDSSLGLESIDMILNTILSTCKITCIIIYYYI